MAITKIGKYEVISTLGRGSMGIVYKALDPGIGRTVAIKTLRSLFSKDGRIEPEILERFKVEARSAGILRHPNIVTVFELARLDDGLPYIVMDYIDGTSLEAIIEKRAPVDFVEVIQYVSQVASAIDYAHSYKVYHRDIKPGNVMIDRYYTPHLLDFGVAKISDVSLTAIGTVVGTPCYMSPEQIRGEDEGGGTDIFALAVISFELLTKERPFPGADFVSVVNSILNKEPISFNELRVCLPTGLEDVFRKALAKKRNDRYATAMDFVRAMARVYNVPIDEKGILGGFSRGMNLESVRESLANQGVVVGGLCRPNLPDVRQRDAVRADAAKVERGANDAGGEERRRERLNHLQAQRDGALTPRATPNARAKSNASKSRRKPPVVLLVLLVFLCSLATSIVLLAFDSNGLYAQFGISRTFELAYELAMSGLFPDGDSESKGGELRQVSSVGIDPHRPFTVTTSVIPSKPNIDAGINPTINPNIELVGVDKRNLDELVVEEEYANGLRILSDAEFSQYISTTAVVGARASLVMKEVERRKLVAIIQGVSVIADRSSFRVKVEFLKILANEPFRSDTRVASIVSRYLSDSDSLVRCFAARTLGSIGGESAKSLLKSRLAIEKDQLVREIVMKTLAAGM